MIRDHAAMNLKPSRRAAEDWINNENSQKKSWMATLSFPQAHTPYQQPPVSLLPNE